MFLVRYQSKEGVLADVFGYPGAAALSLGSKSFWYPPFCRGGQFIEHAGNQIIC